MSQTKTIYWILAVFCMLTLMAQQSKATVLLEENFNTDVIGSGSWTASDASVYVDVSNGWLRIDASGWGDWSDVAGKIVNLTLPIEVEVRMRLVSGGDAGGGGVGYTLPGIRLYFSPPLSGPIGITYLVADNYNWGWQFSTYEWSQVHTMGPQQPNEWVTIKAIIRVDGGELLAKSDMDTAFTPIVTENWSISSEIVKLEFAQPWDAVCDFDYVRVTDLPPLTGDICGTVTQIDGSPVSGVTVKVINAANNQVGDPQVTGADGSYHFADIANETYSVMMVMPLGYAVTPSETQIGITPAIPCAEVDFALTPTIVANNCRSIGYWKHQFDVYTSGRGHAQESASDLTAYLDVVHQHFDVLGIYVDLENYDFEDAKDVLTVKGGNLMLDRAKQQLFALVLNFASGRIGNETVISLDGRVAAEAVTMAANLINDGIPANDEQAKTICDMINNGSLIDSGIIPSSSIRYKLTLEYLPLKFSLSQNYPNPFNSSTTISFELAQPSHVTLTVYNLLGQKVATVFEGMKGAGAHRVAWVAEGLPSGTYLARLTTGDGRSREARMVLVK